MHLILEKDSQNDVKIEQLNIVNINSYAPRDTIFKPLSWGVCAGLTDFKDSLHAKLTGEVGFGYGFWEDSYIFAMMKPSLYYRDEAIVGIAPKLGTIVNFSKLKLGMMMEKNFYSDGGKVINSEVFTTIKISSDMSLNLDIDYEKVEQLQSSKTVGARLFYYF
jgi:hypothetical protein